MFVHFGGVKQAEKSAVLVPVFHRKHPPQPCFADKISDVMPGKTLKFPLESPIPETQMVEDPSQTEAEGQASQASSEVATIGLGPPVDQWASPAPGSQPEPDQPVFKTIEKFAFPGLKEIPVTQLVFDDHQQWGQVRKRDPDHVNRLQRDIEMNPPRTRIEILVRDMGNGMLRKFYADSA